MRMAFHPLLHLGTGLTLWAVWFVLVYAGMTLGCRFAPPDPQQGPWNWINLSLLVLSLCFAVPLVLLAMRCWRQARTTRGRGHPGDESLEGKQDYAQHFIAWLGATLYAGAAVATLLVAVPLLVVAPCV